MAADRTHEHMLPVESLPPPPTRPPLILVVDEDAGRRDKYRKVLIFEGYEVECLGDCELVLDHIRENPPDLILLDVSDPDSCGFELCGDLRMMDESRLTPVMLLSACEAEEASVVRGLLCGADDYVSTPGRLMELRARVRVQLRNRRDRELLKWARQQRATFRRAAMLDALTGISNRRAGEDVIDEALAGSEPVMVMLVDVDHFKKVNDTYGHPAGDLVLKEIAKTLDRLARKNDTVARLGGEEFVVLIRGAAPRLAPMIAERFRAGVERARYPECDVPQVTVSIGVSTWDAEIAAPTRSAMLEQADQALYAAKNDGRNRVVVRDQGDPAPKTDAAQGGKDAGDGQRPSSRSAERVA